MTTQLEEMARAGGRTHYSVPLTPQARRLLEGPVLATLLRLAAPTVALMLLQGVIAAGEAAFVGRLGSHALAGVSLSFPLVMLMTTLSAGSLTAVCRPGVDAGCLAGSMTPASTCGGQQGPGFPLSWGMGLIRQPCWFFVKPWRPARGATGPALK